MTQKSLLSTRSERLQHYAGVFLHKFWVLFYLLAFCARLAWRAVVHDLSKFGPAEADRFAKLTPQLSETEYGSQKYQAMLEELDVALEHHYEANSHHPEHYGAGVAGMDLADFVEMWCDWRAAIRRHPGGSLQQTIEKNTKRFHLPIEIAGIFSNEADLAPSERVAIIEQTFEEALERLRIRAHVLQKAYPSTAGRDLLIRIHQAEDALASRRAARRRQYEGIEPKTEEFEL